MLSVHSKLSLSVIAKTAWAPIIGYDSEIIAKVLLIVMYAFSHFHGIAGITWLHAYDLRRSLLLFTKIQTMQKRGLLYRAVTM